jgi:hypothetical protein
MTAVAAEAPELAGPALARFHRALNILKARKPFDSLKAEALIAAALAIDAPSAESV